MYQATSGHIKISKFFTSLEHIQVSVSWVYSCITVLETAVNSKHISVYIYTSHNKLRASRKFHCMFSKYHTAGTAKQRKLQTHGQGIADCTRISLLFLFFIFLAQGLFGYQWKVCHHFVFFKSLNCYIFRTIFAYYARHLPESWMVHVKLHFYVKTFHIWSGLGGMNFVWPKERSMQSEFPWLVDHCTHAAWCPCHVPWTRQ